MIAWIIFVGLAAALGGALLQVAWLIAHSGGGSYVCKEKVDDKPCGMAIMGSKEDVNHLAAEHRLVHLEARRRLGK